MNKLICRIFGHRPGVLVWSTYCLRCHRPGIDRWFC